MEVDLPKGEVGGEQFPGRIAGRGWQLERSGVRRGGGLNQEGQTRIRKGRVSRSRATLGGVRKRQVLERWKLKR